MMIKVHIHTNDPGAVLSKAVLIGELSKIKIDNMREEHRELLIEANEKEMVEVQSNEIHEEMKEYGFITVAMGDGISDIFKDLGVDYVIEGGQTMNPSTQDMLDAIDKISDRDIHVIPTTTIPQGIACVTVFNPDAKVEDNVNELNETIKLVKTGSVTYAVRDTEIDGIEIKEGNMLGLVEGKIKEVGEDKISVAENVIDKMIDDDSELITVYYGEEVSEEEANSFIDKLQEKYEDLDIQGYKGNQPLYYFLMSVE